MQRKRKYHSQSEKETKKIAAQIVRGLGDGTVVGLIGDLGSGKTVFVRGALESLGYSGMVQSPTFVIRNDYKIESRDIRTIIHIDLYRLVNVKKGNDEFLEGVGEQGTLTFIEWTERLSKEHKKNMVCITIDFGNNDSRTITVT